MYSKNSKTILARVIGLIIYCWAACPTSVFAHAILVRSNPEKDATVNESPNVIGVWFNEGVGSEYKALAVIDSNGKRVDNHDAEQGLTDKSYLYASVPKLAPGQYTVRYRVVSKDSHIVTGKFQFSVK